MSRLPAAIAAAIVLLLPALAPPSTLAAPSPDSTGKSSDAIEKELMVAENRLMDAVRTRDRATLDKLVASEFAYTSPLSTGELTRKEQFVAGSLGGIRLEAFHFERSLVRNWGEVAVVNTLCRQTGSVGNRPWNPDYIFTDVWLKREGRWQLASRHVTRPIKIAAAQEAPKGAPFKPGK